MVCIVYVQCYTVYTANYTLLCTLQTVQYSVHWKLYSIVYSTIQFTLQTADCTVFVPYRLYCTVYTAN